MKTTHPDSRQVSGRGNRIDKTFSLQEYLVKENYQQLSSRLFVKENSPEIIRLTRRNGKTFFRNFLIPHDRGTALDFLMNRLHTPGQIIPNKDHSSLQKAIMTATMFVTGGMLEIPRHIGKTRMLQIAEVKKRGIN